MAKYHGRNTRLYIGGYDISALAVGLTPVQELELKPYAVMDGVQGYHQLPGLAKDALALEGLFDDANMDILKTMFDSGGGQVVCIPFQSDYFKRGLAAGSVRLQKYNWASVITDINKLSGEFIVDNLPWDETVTLLEKQTQSNGSNGPTLDDGAASSDGAVGYLHVFAASGTTPTLDVEIYHSSDNFVADSTLLLAFTQFTDSNSPGAERKTATGTVKQYVRVQYTIGGTNPSFTFAVMWKRN